MVLSNAPRVVTNIASLINRHNCGGGAKKAGLSRGIGPINQFNPNNIGGVNTLFGKNSLCIPSMTIQTQNYGYRATLSNGMG